MDIIDVKSNSTSYRTITPLFLLIFIDSLGYFLVLPILLKVLQPSYHFLPAHVPIPIRDVLFGLGTAISPLASFICAPIIGNLSDRWGRKNILLLSLCVTFIGFIIPMIGVDQRSLILILLGRAITGASSNSQPIAQAAISDSSRGKQKAIFLSITGVAMTLAMILGPVIGGYLSDPQLLPWFGLKTPFIAGAALTTFNFILMYLLFGETTTILQRTTHMQMTDIIELLFGALLSKRTRLVLISFFLTQCGWSLFYITINLNLAHQFHLSVFAISTFLFHAGIWMALGLMIVYPLWIKMFDITKGVWVSLAIAGSGILIMSMMNNLLLDNILIAPVAIFSGIAYPSLLMQLSQKTQMEYQGWIMGTASALLALAWMVTGAVAGLLVNIAADLPIMIAGICMLVAMMVQLMFSKKSAFYGS